ncbi:MAG: hypothetical protein ABFD54_05825 [Armatimonadota bacterium]|nr:hypothetical protein [bacterium]
MSEFESPKERRERLRREAQQRMAKIYQRKFPVGTPVEVLSSPSGPAFRDFIDSYGRKGKKVVNPDNIYFLRGRSGQVKGLVFVPHVGLCITVEMNACVSKLNGIRQVTFKPDQLRVARED